MNDETCDWSVEAGILTVLANRTTDEHTISYHLPATSVLRHIAAFEKVASKPTSISSSSHTTPSLETRRGSEAGLVRSDAKEETEENALTPASELLVGAGTMFHGEQDEIAPLSLGQCIAIHEHNRILTKLSDDFILDVTIEDVDGETRSLDKK